MSIPYELTGRTNQKARTRAALLDATRALLAEGVNPTVEQTADRAAISRTTAYRYFPNRRALLTAVYPELDAHSLLDADAPADPAARLELVLERFTRHVLEHEPALRAQLRLSLEPGPAEPDRLPFRKGRAIAWIEDALAPLRERMPAPELRRLVFAIRATTGIEALVWLTDVAGLPCEEAAELMHSSARALLRDACRDGRVAESAQGRRRPATST
ncbi:MAG: TetR/AcrR family transcriptional regulator [Thermomicrobiales bacterium]